jgi:heme/copper-type cytochrome/quinol oxidase subunit 4
MRRITAIIGGLIVFVFTFLVLDFFAMHMIEGFPGAMQLAAAIFCALVAFILARGSYKRSLGLRKLPRSWHIN